MNAFFTQFQEATQDWLHLSTDFVQQQAQIFRAPPNPTAVPDAKSVAAGFVKAAEQVDEFMVKAVTLADAHGQKLVDAAVAQSPAKAALAPATVSLKNASQAVVTVIEQVAAAKKSLFRTQPTAA